MIIDNKFELGQTVYLKTDLQQTPRIVIRLSVGPADIDYKLACGIDLTWHTDAEISDKKNESQNVNGFRV